MVRSDRRTTSRRRTTRRKRIASGRRISSRRSAGRGAGRLSSNLLGVILTSRLLRFDPDGVEICYKPSREVTLHEPPEISLFRSVRGAP